MKQALNSRSQRNFYLPKLVCGNNFFLVVLLCLTLFSCSANDKEVHPKNIDPEKMVENIIVKPTVSEKKPTSELVENLLTQENEAVDSSKDLDITESLSSQNSSVSENIEISNTSENTPVKNVEIPNPAENSSAQKSKMDNDLEVSNPNEFSETQKISSSFNAGCQPPKNIAPDTGISHRIPFGQWLSSFKIEALTSGISNATIKSAFRNVYPIQKVIDLDRRQKEYSVTFSKYLRNSISTKRISHGKSMLKKYHSLLKRVESKYAVQPQILIALWAMESNFGKTMGNFSTIRTIATLAHEGRRRNFFRNELLCALHILEEKHIQVDQMKSSWAGAMGQPQFMPSTFFYYAADGNGDSRKDIWYNKADVFASAANYLKKVGWKPSQNWGLEVKLPRNFDPYQARFSEEKTVKEWHSLGVKKANGKPLSVKNNIKGSIVLPSGIKGPAFLVFYNFKMIREWNRSTNYALTIGHLSDRLIGKGKLIAKAPKGEKPLTREQALSLQRNLKKLGFYHDKIDGMVGLKSRSAIREYQKSRGIPADAYPSPAVILRIQQDAGAFHETENNFEQSTSYKIVAHQPTETSLTHEQALSLQYNLKKLGFYRGKIDGILGAHSRNAIREYQQFRDIIPANSDLSPSLISQIQEDAMHIPLQETENKNN